MYIHPVNATEERETPWLVDLTRKAEKMAGKLPGNIYEVLATLQMELKLEGPVQTEWHHYGKLQGKKREYHHCHLNKGKPRYVAVWVVEIHEKMILEIVFAGTHEKVNYNRFK
jgi:mRNA-degrading endonuclease YafQ of YafQ-DinJ toxin-antitoxin module